MRIEEEEAKGKRRRRVWKRRRGGRGGSNCRRTSVHEYISESVNLKYSPRLGLAPLT